MFSEQHVFDQLPAYALGSLDFEEARQVEKHLESCPVCRAELRTYQDVSEQIGLATSLIEPSPGLRQKVMQIAQPKAQAAPTVREKASFFETVRSLLVPWRLAGLVVVLVLATSNLILWRQVQQLQSASRAAQFKTIALAGTNFDPQAQGLIVMSKNEKYGTLVVEDLPPLDVNHQYQLWLMKNGQRINGGTFSVPVNGYTSMWIDSEQPLSSFTSFGITIEPVGGSPQPTGKNVLGGSL